MKHTVGILLNTNMLSRYIAHICFALQATFSGVPYDQLSESFKYLDPVTRLVPLAKLTPETVTYWKNMVRPVRFQSTVGVLSCAVFGNILAVFLNHSLD